MVTYGKVTYWNIKGGKSVSITQMTNIHLTNTINMLRRQIDGSAHDEFVYDNIIAMENELKRRNNNGQDIKCRP